jgi:hypothetical protein
MDVTTPEYVAKLSAPPHPCERMRQNNRPILSIQLEWACMVALRASRQVESLGASVSRAGQYIVSRNVDPDPCHQYHVNIVRTPNCGYDVYTLCS